jgi:hypothetical protein
MREIVRGTFLALTLSTAYAQDKDVYSADYIFPGCKMYLTWYDTRGSVNPETTFNQGMCLGMVGATAALAAHSDVGHAAFSKIGSERALKEGWRCLNVPETVTNIQVVRVVARYVEARPQRMREPFGSLVLEALFDAWACKN